jgi:hypothetical protein
MPAQKARPSVVAVNLLARPGAAPARSMPIEDFPRSIPAEVASAPPVAPQPAPKAMSRAEHGAGGIKAATIGTTVYLLPTEHKRVRRLALDLDTASVHELLLLGLDRLLSDRGEAPLVRYSPPRPKKR